MSAWEFNGNPLTATGNYITGDIGGIDLPPVRGKNVLIPFVHGRTHVKKYFDERVVTLGVTIIGTTAADLETNMDAYLKIVGVRTRGYLVRTMEDATTRHAYAEVDKQMDLVIKGPKLAMGVVEFLLAEPFFRDPNISSGTIIAAGTVTAGTITNPGSTGEYKALVTLDGPLANTVVTNQTNGVVLTYAGTITDGHYVAVNCETFAASYDGTANYIDKISHTGDAAFMVLDAGANVFSISNGTAGTAGTITMDFYPPYF
jgi:hypothetical protein